MASLFTFGEEGAELQGGLVMIRVALTEVASQHDGVTGEQSICRHVNHTVWVLPRFRYLMYKNHDEYLDLF